MRDEEAETARVVGRGRGRNDDESRTGVGDEVRKGKRNCLGRRSHRVDHLRQSASAIDAHMDEKSITKGDKSLVTLADYAAQAVIAWRIGQDEPDMKFLGEEDADALVNGGEDGKEVLRKIAVLVNEAIHSFYPDAKQLSDDEVAALIDKGKGEGGPEGDIGFWTPWMGRSGS